MDVEGAQVYKPAERFFNKIQFDKDIAWDKKRVVETTKKNDGTNVLGQIHDHLLNSNLRWKKVAKQFYITSLKMKKSFLLQH